MALSEWVRPIAYCELDPYCQGVLFSRMASRDIPNAPIWDNIVSFDGQELRGAVDIIYGGSPCQGFSVAGHGKGLEDERSGLFFEIVRLAKEIKPPFLFLENVPAITCRGGLRVVREITEMGYDCRWCVISAASVGALHRRERFFLLGYAKHNGSFTTQKSGSLGSSVCDILEGSNEARESPGTSSSSMLADSNCERFETISKPIRHEQEYSPTISFCNDGDTVRKSSGEADPRAESKSQERDSRGRPTGQHWPFESRDHWQEAVSGVCRTSDGVPFQMDRIKGLGNSVCPQQTKEAFKELMGL